eukprot:2955539-Alexandrium_andersonii.AAC.1
MVVHYVVAPPLPALPPPLAPSPPASFLYRAGRQLLHTESYVPNYCTFHAIDCVFDELFVSP